MIQKKSISPDVAKKSYMKFVYIGLTALVLIVLGWFAFHSYKVYQGKQLQGILGESLHEFQTTTNSYVPQWGEVQLMSELAAQQASGSDLHPFFLVIQAQAMAHQQKAEEAASLVQQAIDELPTDSPYKAYFALTKSLMQLDASAQEEKDKGFAALQALAQDTAYQYRDAALYNLGEYFVAMNEVGKAREAWTELIAQSAALSSSPWVMLAQQKLAIL